MHRLRHAGAHHSVAAHPARARYHHHAGQCTALRNRPIIIMYIRARPCYGDPCQTAQHIAGHANPAGQFLPSADRWQVLTHCQQYRPSAPAEGSAVRAGRSGTLHPAGQSSGRERGGRRGTIGGYRRISFRAFAR